MFRALDEVDNGLLASVKASPGLSVRDLIRPFYKAKSETALRYRIRALELRGLIRLERAKNFVKVYPVEA